MTITDFSTDTIAKIVEVLFHFSLLKCKPLPGDIDKNFYIETAEGEAYILKIAPPDSDFNNLVMQNELMEFLAAQDINLPFPKIVSNRKQQQISLMRDFNDQVRCVRLLTWVPGRMWSAVHPVTTDLLQSLGEVCGKFSLALQGFEHPAAERIDYRWDNSNMTWVKGHESYIKDAQQRELVDYFIGLFETTVAPQIPLLRKSIIQNDFNDNNLVVSEDLEHPKVEAVIDFGDAMYSPVINELAIAVSYAILEQPDPLSAATSVIAAYHKVFPLSEIELSILYSLIANRMVVSVVNSSYNQVKEPDNEYLLITQQPAWNFLQKWRTIPTNLAHYAFRNACGMDAVPNHNRICTWLKNNQTQFAPIIDFDFNKETYKVLDLSVGSLELGNNSIYENAQKFHNRIVHLMHEAGAKVGIGKYNEARPIYTTDNYLVHKNEGPEWRTIHLGIDIFAKASTPVYAPLEGKIHRFANNAIERDYGPTIILEHTISDLSFYTLYGHLSLDSLEGLEIGQRISKGQEIARIGAMPINGNWSPHLHFQIILDMLGEQGNFAGVAFPNQRSLWTNLCPDPNLILGIHLPKESNFDATDILTSRKKHLGRSLSLSYEQPLHITRAYKQYLYTSDGRRYLDTVNNVPHVGHQHPRVVRAAQRQIEVLNTNTRYLHENIVRFAEELCATLPEELSVCHFVNSGSEANELAIRMTRTFTGQKDLLVSEVGYHGNTNACVEVSSYKFDGKGGKGAPDWVHVMPIADPYRGLYRNDDKKAGAQYAQHLQQAIERIQKEGRNIAGFLCEPILSCGGQVVPPPDYFKQAYEYVRAAGGLCIADEVQVGFGRVGKHFWGFELHDVVPDIVVMGKPIGNGHPLGAVITTEAVATAFANGMEYFNTFGGNPVSCAIGREVLQIIHDENLQSNAYQVGEFLKAGLRGLMQQFPIIGDVRGEGFFLGFELVKDRHTLEPAPQQTSYLANRMRQVGILNSTDGLHHNIIKIKPPMCFSKTNASFLLENLEGVLREDFMRR